MSQYHKIVWSEGLFLLPHHLQQWDRYNENFVNLQLDSVMAYCWGITDIKMNEKALENGTFSLQSCHGILPGGVRVDIPEIDKAPENRMFSEHIKPTKQSLGVYLAIPAERPGSINCRFERDSEGDETRYYREYIDVVDENTGSNERKIPVARKSLKILFEGESLDGHDSIKIAELKRATNGAITLREDYIPPCLSISASPWLIQVVSTVLEHLIAKSKLFNAQCQKNGYVHQGCDSIGVLNLWQLQTINSFIPELNHYYRAQKGHPEALYRFLARLVGTLSVYSPAANPEELPEYRHDDLSSSFVELDRLTHELLEHLQPIVPAEPPPPPPPPEPKYRSIALSKFSILSHDVYRADIEADLMTPLRPFYLGIKGLGNQLNLIQQIPGQVKLASINEIEDLIRRNLTGMNLIYLASPPPVIQPKPEYSYFILDSTSNFWGGIRRSGSLAIYIPIMFGQLEPEFIVALRD